MSTARATLVIAGTREADTLIRGLVARGRTVVVTLPEPDRKGADAPLPAVAHRFEDTDAFAHWLSGQNLCCIVDAGHAFEAEMSRAAALFCVNHALPYLRVLRRAWVPQPHDRWTVVADLAEAVVSVPATARVFANTGRAHLDHYAGFTGQRLYLRLLSDPRDAPPYEFMSYIPGEAPFSVAEEEHLFRQLRISHLITRNVGGAASQSKLIAARKLGLSVIMIARPAPPSAPCVETAQEALAWTCVS